MLKKLSVLSLLIVSLLVLTSCVKTKLPKEAEELKVYWGDKIAIKTFLDSPSAKAERWLIEALGK